MALDYRSRIESLELSGNKLIQTVEKVIEEGNARKIAIKQGDDTLAEFPLTFGVVGAVLAPALAGIGAIAALAAGYTIEVERTAQPSNEAEPDA
jgi:hypothetical protein